MRITLDLSSTPVPREARPLPLLVRTEFPKNRDVLLGAAKVDQKTARAVALDAGTAAEVAEFGAPTAWGRLARGERRRLALILAAAEATPTEIAQWFGKPSEAAEIWRWIALTHRACPELQAAEADGRLSLGHCRYLLPLPVSEQKALTLQCLRGRWSVARLRAHLRASDGSPALPSTADVSALEQRLGDALGTSVEIEWPDDPRRTRALTIAWYDIEALKGILARLAEGPDLGGSRAKARTLRIEVQDASELAALTQHLSDEP